MGALSLLLLPVLAGASLGSGSTGREARSGLYGKTTMGPLMPMCQKDVPCYGPAERKVLIFSRNRHIIARARTTATGTYRISLAPGTYRVRSKVGFGVVKPPSVTVPRGRFDRVDLILDTGIR